jgi:hypothetical protein
MPMNHKDDTYVRLHYYGMSLVLSDPSMPDKIAVILCIASDGPGRRTHPRRGRGTQAGNIGLRTML